MFWIFAVGVFLFLLFAFPKQVGVLLLVICAGGAVLYLKAEQQAAAQEKEQKLLKTHAYWDTSACKDTHPIVVSFLNNSRRATKEIRFSLQAHRPGFSKPVVDDYRNTDMIVEAGQANALCAAIATSYGNLRPADASTLVWSARLNSVEYASR